MPQFIFSGTYLMDRLKREIEEAIKRGVDVDAVCRLEKFRVQAFGMRCAIVFSLLAPLVIYGLLYFAALYKLDMKLHEEYALYVCFGNLVSIIAFGFHGPPVIRLPKKKD